jgi:hypothetical protein
MTLEFQRHRIGVMRKVKIDSFALILDSTGFTLLIDN